MTTTYAFLAFPTADNTNITCDTINFTADGANLANGGGTEISEKPKQQQEYGGLAVTSSAYLRF